MYFVLRPRWAPVAPQRVLVLSSSCLQTERFVFSQVLSVSVPFWIGAGQAEKAHSLGDTTHHPGYQTSKRVSGCKLYGRWPGPGSYLWVICGHWCHRSSGTHRLIKLRHTHTHTHIYWVGWLAYGWSWNCSAWGPSGHLRTNFLPLT